MRLNLNEKQQKLLMKIQVDGVREYKSSSKVIEKDLELLWQEEKVLAYAKLNENLKKHYEKHPEDKETGYKLAISL